MYVYDYVRTYIHNQCRYVLLHKCPVHMTNLSENKSIGVLYGQNQSKPGIKVQTVKLTLKCMMSIWCLPHYNYNLEELQSFQMFSS